ncbi:MAG: aldose epimerase family protein [Saprospiraceae bacterium]
MKIERSFFGLMDKQVIEKISMTNKNQQVVEIINYGATVHSWITKDKNGVFRELLLGKDEMETYQKDNPNFGCVVGRYANRIQHGRFNLLGIDYNVSKNLQGHHLHGGFSGFGKKVWNIEGVYENEDKGYLILTYLSPHLDEGFPGNLKVKLTFSFSEENELSILHEAMSDQDTICNLTNHCYFNLGETNHVLDHYLMIDGNYITETNQQLIPTGKLLDVSQTPFDFTSFKMIGARINDSNELLTYGNGYDVNYVLNPRNKKHPKPSAHLFSQKTGIHLEVFTNKPGLQLYTGNWLEYIVGKNKEVYVKHSGICLEPQFYPNSPNHPDFPTATLIKGKNYHHLLQYKVYIQ